MAKWTSSWKYKTDWSFLPSSYIYHIRCGRYIYIGQSKAEKGETRIHQHIMNFFLRDRSGYPELAAEIRKRGLKNTSIEIYVGDLYGVSQELMDAFKRRFKKKDGKDLSNIDAAEILHILKCRHENKLILENKSIGGQDISITMAGRDARGGNNTGLSAAERRKLGFVSEKKGFITKFMSIDDAYWSFSTDAESTEDLYLFRDKFNEIVFTDKWKDYFATFKKTFGNNVTIPKDAEKTFSELTKEIADLMQEYVVKKIVKNELKDRFSKDVKKKIADWYTAKHVLLTKDIISPEKINANIGSLHSSLNNIKQLFDEKTNKDLLNLDKIIEYIYDAVYHTAFNLSVNTVKREIYNEITGKNRKRWSAKMKREVNDNKELSKKIAEEFTKKTGNDTSYYFKLNIKNMTKKQLAIIGVPNFFKDSILAKSGRNKMQWWDRFTEWKQPNGEQMPGDAKKRETLNIFKSIYASVSDKNYYQKANPENIFPLDGGFAYYTQRNRLSFSVHEAFQSLEITFAENRWTEFYAKMVSLIISGGRDPWTETIVHKYGLTYGMEEVLIRKNEQLVKDENGNSYIVVHPLYTYWEATPEQIDIY